MLTRGNHLALKIRPAVSLAGVLP